MPGNEKSGAGDPIASVGCGLSAKAIPNKKKKAASRHISSTAIIKSRFVLAAAYSRRFR
jgi:hypothetical protein